MFESVFMLESVFFESVFMFESVFILLKAPWGGITAALLFWTIAKAFNALGALGVLGVLSVLAYCIVALDKRINQNL